MVMKTLAIVVNYKSAAMILPAVRSVLDSDSLGPVKVVVVDNSEDREEAQTLETHLPPEVDLLVSLTNIGFGRACNRALENNACDFILLLNPDAKLLPECLLRLQQILVSDRRAAAVSPKVYLDEQRRFLLPPSYPPAWMAMEALAEKTPLGHIALGFLLSLIWRRYSVKEWRAKRPVKARNLSGGLALLKQSAVQQAGGLFDPSFFLYFEDSDLFLRLRRAGYTLFVEPRAEAIHFYNQCDQDRWEWKQSCMLESRGHFMKKHYYQWFLILKNADGRHQPSQRCPPTPLPAPDFTTPFVLDVPEKLQDGWLFEFSPNHSLLPAAGYFGSGPCIRFPETCWEMLAPGRYFCRIGKSKGTVIKSMRYSWEVGTP